jgi:aminocarboxymuconate-semialdehyde decarboxylase
MTRVVDFHAHHMPRGAIEAAASGARWHGTTFGRTADGLPVIGTGRTRKVMASRRYAESPDERAQRMTAVGVDLQVLSMVPNLYRYGLEPATAVRAAREVNDELAGIVAGRPDRFAGLATLPMQDVPAAVAELERAMSELGLAGVSVGTHVAGRSWDAQELFPVLEAAEATGALVFLHPVDPRIAGGSPGYHLGNLVGNPFEVTMAAAALVLGGVLDRLPALTVLLAHAGGFTCANVGRFNHGYRARSDASAVARRLPEDYLAELHYDCLSHDERSLRYVIEIAGPGRVVLGTDDPADMGLSRPVEWLAGRERISDDHRRLILSGNADRLLGR